MLLANKLFPQGRGLAPVLVKRAATVELDWDTRCKSRFDATDSAGRQIGFFLPRGTVVRGGDVAVIEDGSLLRVVAAPQAVLIVRARPEHDVDLLRAAYHLGNRHVALEMCSDHLKLEADPVLAAMLRVNRMQVDEAVVAFEPEVGAYAKTAAHGQHAQGEHGHDHAHAHGHDHAHDDHGVDPHRAGAPHVHGPGCGHDHGAHEH